MNGQKFLYFIGRTALMTVIYFITFILTVIVITDVLNSDFLEPSAGMEFTLFLSFYIFIVFAIIINIISNSKIRRKWTLTIPLILCAFFFTINNGGLSELHNRMLLPTISFLIAVYAVEIPRTLLNKPNPTA